MMQFLNGKVTLHIGDCLEKLDELPENSVDSVCTDPPYHLVSITKRFARTGGADSKPPKKHHQFRRLSVGFMGRAWDGGDIVFRTETWEKVFRVLKPGGHLASFGAPKNYHRMACAIENAGFEIRDSLMFMFGTGFPKSQNIGKKVPGWEGWGSALKPAYEPIVLARKPLEGTIAENVLKWGTGAINIDGCRIDGGEQPAREVHDLREGVNYAGNSLAGRVDGSLRSSKAVGTTKLGRWPANVCHDGSDEVIAAFPESDGQNGYVGPEQGDRPSQGIYGDFGARPPSPPRGDSGSAARFFFSAKADKLDRAGSGHPTVKPIGLMRWIVRLITPPNGTVLDLFAGSGTTGEAAYLEGFNAILIEREQEYADDIMRRMSLINVSTEERKIESLKARGRIEQNAGPLFSPEAA